MDGIERIEKLFLSNKEDLIQSKYYRNDELEFMINIFNSINQLFKSGNVPEDEITHFLIMLDNILREVEIEDNTKEDVADNILVFYNFYRIYGNKLFSISYEDYKVMRQLFMTFSGDKKLDELDQVADIVMDYENFKKYRKQLNNTRLLTRFSEDVVDYCYELALDYPDNKLRIEDIRSNGDEIIENYKHINIK